MNDPFCILGYLIQIQKSKNSLWVSYDIYKDPMEHFISILKIRKADQQAFCFIIGSYIIRIGRLTTNN